MEMYRTLAKADLFFLLVFVLKRKDAFRQWLLDRCREYQADPFGYLDLWARGHYKSTIITFAYTIFEIINDSELTHGIFSHTKKISLDFLRQIKTELEQNTILKVLFPDIFYQDPEKESPKWNELDGLLVKRNGNPKELTVEAWGVVKNQPTGRHFDRLKYDDLVTLGSVNTPEQILKTTNSFQMSLNLGSEFAKVSMIGTFYAHNDTYNILIKDKTVIPRVYPAMIIQDDFDTGVLFSAEKLIEKRKQFGAGTFSTQMLLDPSVANNRSFFGEWFSYYPGNGWDQMNRYIIVDPASSKSKKSDYTVIMVIGLNFDKNYYVIDAVRDRMNLSERTNKVFEFVEKYNPLKVYYEEYGQQADREHIELEMKRRNFRFNIQKVAGNIPKKQRILRLQPDFEERRIFFPTHIPYFNTVGDCIDFTQVFLNDEYLSYPAVDHDDMLDCLARIYDIDGKFPNKRKSIEPYYYNV